MQEIRRLYGDQGGAKARAGHLATVVFGIMLMSLLMLLLPCMAGKVYAAYPTVYVGGTALEDREYVKGGSGKAEYRERKDG